MRHLLRLSLAALLAFTAASCSNEPPAGEPDSGIVEEADAEVAPSDASAEETDAGPVVRRDAGAAQDGSVASGDAAVVVGDDAGGPECTDECTAGSQVCDGPTGYRSCGQYDADPCLELSASVACAGGATCVADTCVAPCRDECAVGSAFCKDRATLQVCGNFDQDSCREPGGDTACGAGKKCEAGACVADTAACADECATAGSAACSGDAVRTCGEYDDDSCRDLSAPVACAAGQACKSGACVTACSDTCPLAGAKDCLGGAVRTCGDANSDGCLEWSVPAPCPSGQTCSAGSCATSCVNECQTAGGLTCSADGSGVLQCGQYDADSCLDLSSAVPCAGGKACRNGVCTAVCSDECQLGAQRCGGDGKSLESCGNFDADPCLEYGGAVACSGGAACAAGACQTPCSNECTPSASVECVSGQSATHVCGQYDADPCLEWSSPASCAAWETCEIDTCLLGATPGKVVINEVVFDAVGTDSAAGNNLFVELWGPVGLDLEGFALVGVNGADGKDYATVALDGQTIASDGYFLVAHPNGAASLLAIADLTSDKVDFQNGPDSIQLRWHGRVVDALAYGNFGTGTFPKGEGTAAAAPATNSGKSLTRNPAHADTDVNSADFAVSPASPRLAAVACADACAANATQCGGTNNEQLQTCADANGDGCREWGAATSCGTGKFCQGGACVASCTNLCPTLNANQCGGLNNQQIQTCGDSNGDGCREWSSAVDCGAGKACAGGACVASCSDACAVNATQCGGTGSAQLQTCGDFNGDGCREWGTPATCPGGQTCSAGACVIACSSVCTPANSTKCSGSQVQTCTDTNLDGCLEWSTAANCPGTDVCQGTACTCSNECAAAGNTKCDANGLVMTCIQSGGCLKWSTAEACPNSGSCKFGACCVNDCEVGQTQCSGQQIQSCGEYDSDGCLEWSIPATCATAGQICQGTKCQTPCTNSCPASGASQCSGLQVTTCGDGNGDGCLEWGTPVGCGSGQTCALGACVSATAPQVMMISPQGTVQTTQGESIHFVVDATPTAGRSISEVTYWASGAQVGRTTVAPHTFDYVVPGATPTNTTVTVQAKAKDNVGEVGVSAQAYLSVKNDKPVASFTAVISATNTVTVDASSVTDTETATANLEVCWDWDNNGTCDTAYATAKIATHVYSGSGNYTVTVGMKVRDAAAQESSTTKSVTFSNLQYLGGQDVTTTLWTGTVVVTGDLTVPAGNTLTIDKGTQVLFVRADANADGIGDYTLTVNGALVVNGTAAEPVVFTGQDANAKVKGGWDRIQLNGAGSSLSWLVIEYADVGVDIRTAATLSHVTVRKTRWNCISLSNADNTTLTDVAVSECGWNGVEAGNGSTGVTLTRLSSTANTASGLYTDGASALTVADSTFGSNGHEGLNATGASTVLNLSGSTVEQSTTVGVLFVGGSSGAVTHNQIRQSGGAGVQVQDDGAGVSPNPVVTFNNIYSNAVTGSSRGALVSTPFTAATGSSYTAASAAYTAPAGMTLKRVEISYSESEYYTNDCQGQVQTSSGSGLLTFTTGTSQRWVDLPANTTSIRAYASCGSSYSRGTMNIHTTQTLASDGTSDVVALTVSGTPDLRYNYLGTFPNVLSRVSMSRSNALNLQGFVGVPFDSSWSTGPYLAGTLNTSTWSGDVYVTGDITIPSGKIVTVGPSTRVFFVAHDQNGDGEGDFSITATGQLAVSGSTGTEVVFAGYNTTNVAFQAINLNGSTADASGWSHCTVQNGHSPVFIRGGSQLSYVTVLGASLDGITIAGTSAGAALTDVTVDGAKRVGVMVDNGDNVALTRLTARNSLANGLEFKNGSTGNTVSRLTSTANGGDGVLVWQASSAAITDSSITSNSRHGVNVLESSPSVSYSLLKLNGGSGLRVEGNASPTADYDVVTYNGEAGVSVFSSNAGSPAPTIQHSNIYGNATTATVTGQIYDISPDFVAATGSSYSAASAAYTATAGRTLRRVQVSYSESEYYTNDCQGQVQTGAGSGLLTYSSGTSTRWVDLPAGTTSVRAYASCGSSYSRGTMTLLQVEELGTSTADHYELAAITESGQTIARSNYWTATIGDVPSKIYMSRANSVDFQGATGFEYTNAGPRP
ncbi:MAG TPA: right-handed parallel beta-helix repeat-containing protein [Myxococcales bacterium]